MTLTCPRCGSTVNRTKAWAVFCSERCRRNYRRTRANVIPKPCAGCAITFTPRRGSQKFCSDPCRMKIHNAKHKPISSPKMRRLHCHWCSGKHISTACPNRGVLFVKQFGSLGPLREYVPPPGVKVRIRNLPHNVFGEDLRRIAR